MQSQDQATTVEEVVLIDPGPAPEAGRVDDGAGGAAGIVLGLLLIFLAISIGTASLARERRAFCADRRSRRDPSRHDGRITVS